MAIPQYFSRKNRVLSLSSGSLSLFLVGPFPFTMLSLLPWPSIGAMETSKKCTIHVAALEHSLETIANAPAWMLTSTRHVEHIMLLLCHLHWLPGHFWVPFKRLVLNFKTLKIPSSLSGHLAIPLHIKLPIPGDILREAPYMSHYWQRYMWWWYTGEFAEGSNGVQGPPSSWGATWRCENITSHAIASFPPYVGAVWSCPFQSCLDPREGRWAQFKVLITCSDAVCAPSQAWQTLGVLWSGTVSTQSPPACHWTHDTPLQPIT